MKILKTDKRLIDEGYRYKIDGNLISDGDIDLTDLHKELYVTGSIYAGGLIEAGKFIKAGGFIKAGEYIKAGGLIEAGGSIKAGKFIKAGGFIEAGEYIKAGGFIEAGWSIKAGKSIYASQHIHAGSNYGISAGLHITCKGTLSFGLKAFAGVCAWREISKKEKTITCSKLIGGGVVEYGILNETGEKHTIVIDGKEIELSEESYKALKESLTKE